MSAGPAELLGRSFLAFPHFAAVDHHIMRVALSLDLDLAKFNQSCFHFSMFRWLDLQGNDAVIRVYDEAGNVIETHEHAGAFQRVVGRSKRLRVMCQSTSLKRTLLRNNWQWSPKTRISM